MSNASKTGACSGEARPTCPATHEGVRCVFGSGHAVNYHHGTDGRTWPVVGRQHGMSVAAAKAVVDACSSEARSDERRGLYGKYRVERRDGTSGPGGKHEHCEYFVLDLAHDKYAFPALLAYASACQDEYPELAADLRRRSVGERGDELAREQRPNEAKDWDWSRVRERVRDTLSYAQGPATRGNADELTDMVMGILEDEDPCPEPAQSERAAAEAWTTAWLARGGAIRDTDDVRDLVVAARASVLGQGRESPSLRDELSVADDALTELWNGIRKAARKHPGGPDGMRSLVEEVGEVASAMRRETPERVRAELIDVAVVAIRWWVQLGAAQVRGTDGGPK